jgi:hypothetical protein
MTRSGIHDGLAEVQGEEQGDGNRQQVAAPFPALPHRRGGDQLGQAKQDEPDRDRPTVIEQRRQVPGDQGDEVVAGVFTQLPG